MSKEQIDVEEYHTTMEHIESGIMDEVLSSVERFDPSSYVSEDVMKALSKDHIDMNDFAALLSPAADNFLEPMAIRAREDTRKHFGNSVCMFTPIYTSNYCTNQCTYCGFNCKNDIHRAKLSLEEVDGEMKTIASTGLTEILILTGESRTMSDVEYIGDCVKIATRYFSSIGVEVYPMNSDEYRYLHDCGVDYVTVFQETYDPKRYADLHLGGPKRVFSYRFDAQERALIGGMRGVAFGALLGLGDFRADAFACGIHAYLIQRKYPHAEISFSLPRLRPCIGNGDDTNPVHERQLLQVALAYRIFMPFAGETISTRECKEFRDNIVGLCATKISAGVCVGIGGHSGEEKGDEQFTISDPRTVEEVRKALKERGLQPVFNDYVRV
ncbi:MAG: 2-iminoacetate synthase ThiH [Candidatus Methanogranum gryphiswaldense]|nr:MAG: 2-iminoacetate synthase ThiH [Candidatus Methanogranum sp. U3.2.1]